MNTLSEDSYRLLTKGMNKDMIIAYSVTTLKETGKAAGLNIVRLQWNKSQIIRSKLILLLCKLVRGPKLLDYLNCFFNRQWMWNSCTTLRNTSMATQLAKQNMFNLWHAKWDRQNINWLRNSSIKKTRLECCLLPSHSMDVPSAGLCWLY